MSQNEAAQYWEERYSTATQVWSGRANAAMVAVASELTPGTALDLGCGEGGDSLWLAEQGWRVTGVDISPTAVRRGADEAARRGIPADRNTWVAADLETWTTDARFDLVSACFLQSNVTLSREAILRRAATLVAPGGHLLVVAHAAPPPWSKHFHAEMPTPAEELAALDLPADAWETVTAVARERPATGPDGESAVLLDSVVVVRRKGM